MTECIGKMHRDVRAKRMLFKVVVKRQTMLQKTWSEIMSGRMSQSEAEAAGGDLSSSTKLRSLDKVGSNVVKREPKVK